MKLSRVIALITPAPTEAGWTEKAVQARETGAATEAGTPGEAGSLQATLSQGWEESQRSLPEGTLPFLEPAFLEHAWDDVHVEPDVAAGTARAAARMAASPELTALAWHCHYCLYRDPAYPSRLIRNWPLLAEALGSDASFFYLPVALSNLPALREIYARHAITREILRTTLDDVSLWIEAYRETRGVPALRPFNLPWLRNHFTAGLFALGRLQFQPGTFQQDAVAFRHRTDDTVVALSGAGVRYRADGQVDGAGDVFDPEGAWTATLQRDDSGAVGVPLDPSGRAIHRTVRLPASEWQPALSPGDPVLHLHIPAGSPMDFLACGESLRHALTFFPRHFPDLPFNAFTCSSWLLDAQLDGMLPPWTNIVRFQREMYLLPSPSSGRGTLERVFGKDHVDLAVAPRNTTLRRAIVEHLEAGGHLRSGRSFLLRDDLYWGTEHYRRQPHPW